MGDCGVNLYKPGKYIHEDELNQAQKRIEQLEAELKNKDAVRLWNENEKLKEANRILRDGLRFYSLKSNYSCVDEGRNYMSDYKTYELDEETYADVELGTRSKQALEQADKIMEGDEG
jgi:hypothetical protein